MARRPHTGGSLRDPGLVRLPSHTISPFQASDLDAQGADRAVLGQRFLDQRFAGSAHALTRSGREALALALRSLQLTGDDVVTIHTTTENRYISACVTEEIDKVCRWSRTQEPRTRALLVNHEFGFPLEDMSGLAALGLPIIEDCCHAFASQNASSTMGTVGDFVIYSLPKFFPIRSGGILAWRPGSAPPTAPTDPGTGEWSDQLLHSLGLLAPHLGEMSARRRENHVTLARGIEHLGLRPRFELRPYHVPGVFMFTTPADCDLPALKLHMNAHGIESSVFYGEAAYFVPCHDRLEEADLAYFVEVLEAHFTNTMSQRKSE